MAKALTYEEFQDLALKNYYTGGDAVVECWGRSEFDEYVRDFGPISRKEAFSIFGMYRENEEEEAAARRWMSGEPGYRDEVPTDEDNNETDDSDFPFEENPFLPDHLVNMAGEKDYGPGNPWDAPGMRVSDFITGVY